ncbi:hypothetical protein ALC53_01129 [Atta colombica]|uniref:Uncharacterized protein n=1 Tax=Atta colombica TaxID=520822 RepID=A0A151I610_9HYME|nr:hypothetical protein ALC53_01129 [Atta colombica]
MQHIIKGISKETSIHKRRRRRRRKRRSSDVEEAGEHGLRAGFQHQRKVALRAHTRDNTVPMWGK